jgi:hypothetical protein
MTDDLLIAYATTAHRTVDPRTGRIRPHPAWHDLDAEGREALFAETELSRALEAALDPEGLSTTARAVLAKIRGA